MTTSTMALLVSVVLSAGTLATQAQSDAETLKLLRQTIADQKKYPDKVIRTYTSQPPDEEKSAAPPSAVPASPSRASVAPSSAAPASEPEPVLVAQSKRAPEPNAVPSTPMSADRKAAAAELERQFLNGKISAKKYQKALADLNDPSKVPIVQPPTEPKPAPKVATTPVKPQPSPGATNPTTPPQQTVEQKRVTEVETKIDNMIRKKEARETAAKTNAPPASTGPLTKRQRLDFLLRQVIEGKLSDAEYKKEREKIMAEPD